MMDSIRTGTLEFIKKIVYHSNINIAAAGIKMAPVMAAMVTAKGKKWQK